MACPHIKRCTLHDQLGTRAALTVWQTLFCDSGFDRCARYRRVAVRAFVPEGLLPDGRSHLPPSMRSAAPRKP